MPLTRFKLSAIADGGIETADLADGAVTLAKTDNLFENTTFTGDDGIVVPKGTTAERPVSPTVGEVRFNTTLDQLEQYTNDSGWQGISPPPVVTSVDVNSIDSTAGTQTLVITGQNFDTSAVGALVDANGTTKTATTSTRNSSSQITIVYSGGDVIGADVPEPLDTKVTNGSGLAATLEDAIGVDDNPVWTTASGSLGTVYEDEAISTITLQATDPETGGSITYTVTSGSLPTGLSLNSSTGAITGTPNVNDSYNASGVTHNFSVTATGADSDTTVRAFSILRKWYDGSTAALAAPSAWYISNTLGVTTDGWYWLKGNGSTAYYTYNLMNAGGWTLWYRYRDVDSSIEGYEMGALMIESANPSVSGAWNEFDGNDDCYMWEVPSAFIGSSTSNMTPNLYLGMAGSHSGTFSANMYPSSASGFKYRVQVANGSGTNAGSNASELWNWLEYEKIASTAWGLDGIAESTIRNATGTNYRFGTSIGTMHFGHNLNIGSGNGEFESINFRNSSGTGGASWGQSSDIWNKSGWGAIDATTINGGPLGTGTNNGGGWGSNGGDDRNGGWQDNDFILSYFQTPNMGV